MTTFRTIKNCFLILFTLIPLTLQAQWVQTNLPSNADILDIFADGSTVFAGTKTSGLYISKDNGMTWTQCQEHKVLSYGGFESLDGKIFCTVGGAGVHYTTDLGATWKDVNNGLNVMNTSTTVLCGGNLFALVLSDGIYRSTDKGASWTKLTGGLAEFSSLNQLIACGNTLYTAQYLKDAYSSSDQGQTWKIVQLGNPNPIVFTLVSCNNLPFLFAYGKGFFYSTDNGQTWPSLRKDLVANDIVYEGGNYFAFGYADGGKQWGVFRFKLGDTTLTPMNSGLPQSAIITKALNTGKYMFAAVKNNAAGTDKNGIYRIATSELGATDVETAAGTRPEKFELRQNYPNPFNPTTTITYSLPEAGHVRLAVYNLLGKEVAVLADEYQAASVHTVNFNAEGLTSGIYLYRLEAGKFTAYKKLLLLK
ncbi:MAG: T9SS type A sorting domain-containing protein [Ignavibacteria bacterium]|jgi:photosystem II stability/assembly factor-like uncharacterized protein|nr:T9SS type A sorting domain-containing protein [Ignavibacteria bacterium]MCU7501049.1 T9SS type A sorting domain-containing protein [Ignavibacteria bacterium]MCU7514036.1 T9SS type A sorting domain-containing protein [Ignavibacteria bacterium]MCU7521191.1 T9SS type A sorting domain-containing protein [Ignavibacteria bacterium]MCU7526238.1 T9SS type A sorting domain-containing protein [Ignavibacteria bacterium]